MLTTSQAAALVNRSVGTIRSWIRAGLLPGSRRVRTRVLGGFLVPRAALLARVELLEVPPPAAPPVPPSRATVEGLRRHGIEVPT